MYINISLLESYFEKNKMTITTNIDIESSTPTLKFTRGKDKDGSRVEFLNYEDLYNILIANNILGKEGLLSQERKSLTNDLNSGIGNRNNREKKMESLIYDTLAKYIIQMFCAASGKRLFPSIIPLENHKNIFFKEIE